MTFGNISTPIPQKTQAEIQREWLLKNWDTRLNCLRLKKIGLQNDLQRLGPAGPDTAKVNEQLGSYYKDLYDRLVEDRRRLEPKWSASKILLAKYYKEVAPAYKIRAEEWYVKYYGEQLENLKEKMLKLPEENRKAIRRVRQQILQTEREIDIAEKSMGKISKL